MNSLNPIFWDHCTFTTLFACSRRAVQGHQPGSQAGLKRDRRRSDFYPLWAGCDLKYLEAAAVQRSAWRSGVDISSIIAKYLDTSATYLWIRWHTPTHQPKELPLRPRYIIRHTACLGAILAGRLLRGIVMCWMLSGCAYLCRDEADVVEEDRRG